MASKSQPLTNLETDEKTGPSELKQSTSGSVAKRCASLTSHFTCRHHVVARVGLQPHRVLHPVDVNLGLACGLALQDHVTALLDDLHGGVLEDRRESGRQIFVWK